MKRFSAQYIITNTGSALKKGIVTTNDDGKIINVEDTGGILQENESVRFYNGIIIPGFVNCHCHLELSYLKRVIPSGTGLAGFIRLIRDSATNYAPDSALPLISACEEMYREGINLCADICNSAISFSVKKQGRIKFINLIEVFGINPDKVQKRLDEISKVTKSADEAGLLWYMVPHSTYSVSKPLFNELKKKTRANKVTSIHFMESESENIFLERNDGPLMDSYKNSGLTGSSVQTVRSHTSAILNDITRSGNLILVHNTFADLQTVMELEQRENLFWCICPNSNLYIENRLPPVRLLMDEGCKITLGTDSLASNSKLSILEELKTVQKAFPEIPLTNLIYWATANGAKALGEEKTYGSIEAGMNPGLLLLQDLDLHNMKLLPGSSIERLI